MKINDVFKGKIFIKDQSYEATVSITENYQFRLEVISANKPFDFLMQEDILEHIFEFEVLTFISTESKVYYITNGWLQSPSISCHRLQTTYQCDGYFMNCIEPKEGDKPLLNKYLEIPIFKTLVFSSTQFDAYVEPDYSTELDETVLAIKQLNVKRKTKDFPQAGFYKDLKACKFPMWRNKYLSCEFETCLSMEFTDYDSFEQLTSEIHDMRSFISLLLSSPLDFEKIELLDEDGKRYQFWNYINTPLTKKPKATRKFSFLLPYQELIEKNPNFIRESWSKFKGNKVYKKLFYEFYTFFSVETSILNITGYIEQQFEPAKFNKQQKTAIDDTLKDIVPLIIEKLTSLNITNNHLENKWQDTNHWLNALQRAAKNSTFQDKFNNFWEWSIIPKTLEYWNNANKNVNAPLTKEEIFKSYKDARNNIAHGNPRKDISREYFINRYIHSILILELAKNIFNLDDDYLLNRYKDCFTFSSNTGFLCFPSTKSAEETTLPTEP